MNAEHRQPGTITQILSVILVAGLGMWIRVAYFQNTLIDEPLQGEPGYYLDYARTLVDQQTFARDLRLPASADTSLAPGYPIYLTAIIYLHELAGIDVYRGTIYSQSLLGAAICLLTFLLGRLFLPHGWALAAALLSAISPHLVSMGNYVLGETLFSFLLLLAVYMFLLGFRHESKSAYLLGGLGFGLACLTNPASFMAPILLSAVALLVQKSRGHTGARATLPLIALLPFLLLVFGWCLPSATAVPGSVAEAGDRGLLTRLIAGSHRDLQEVAEEGQHRPDQLIEEDIRDFDGSYGVFLSTLASRVAADPKGYLEWYLADKPYNLWGWDMESGKGDIYVYPVFVSMYHTHRPAILTYSLMYAMHDWLLLCMLLGLIPLVVRYRSDSNASFAVGATYLLTASVSTVYIATQAEVRYAVPLRPEMYLCAVFFLYSVMRTMGKQGSSAQAAAEERRGLSRGN